MLWLAETPGVLQTTDGVCVCVCVCACVSVVSLWDFLGS